MADPTLTIQVATDAAAAATGLDNTAASIDKVGSAASTASGKLDGAAGGVDRYAAAADGASSKVGAATESIDKFGGSAGDTSSALSAFAAAADAAGMEGLAAGLDTATVALDSLEGITILWRVAAESAWVTRVKSTVSTVANTAATVANTVATTAASAAAKAWAVTQAVLNAVLTANPIGLVVAAIALLIGGLILAYQKSETFRQIVQTAFAVVKTAISSVVTWVTDNLVPLFETVWTNAQGPLNSLKSLCDTVFGFIKGIVDGVKGAFDGVAGAIQSVIDWIGRLKLPDWLTSIGSTVAGIVGGSAAVSIAAAPAVGARGYSAAVTSGRVAAAGGRRATGGVTVQVMVPPTANPVETGRQIVAMIRQFEGAAGNAWRSGVVTA